MNMKGAVVILVIALFARTQGAPFGFDMPGSVIRTSSDGPFCRMFKGPARCADEPLPIEDKEPWCPYRMCAPSYVPAETCPTDSSLQATDKCRVEVITRDVYKCDGKAFGHNYVPVGCTVGSPGCKQVPTCSCVKIEDYTTKVWTQITPFTPSCPGTSNPTTSNPTTTSSTTTSSTTTSSTTTTTTPTTTTTTTLTTRSTTTTNPILNNVNVDCAKCGQVLECYVNSGSPTADAAVCDVILNASKFCAYRRGRATSCGQQCSGSQGVKCFEGESWGTCPAVLGSKNGSAKCKGGASRGRPAALSNFASYTVTIGASPRVSCLFNKCDSGSTCPCANP